MAATQTITRSYDNQDRVRTFTDVFGQIIGYRYDQNGNLKQMLYPDATPATWADIPAVTYTYDELDRLKTVTDWSRRVTTYTWDNAGRLTGIQRPNFTTRTITPDAAGQTLSIMERTGAGRALLYLRFGYDDAGRLQKRLVAPPLPKGVGVQAWSSSFTGDNRFSRLNYDDDGNQGAAFRLKGENPTLSWQLSPSGVWTPQYPSTVMLNAEQGEHVWNVKNQLLEVRHYSSEMGEMKPVTQCRYDPEGRLVKVTSGRLLWNNFDPASVPTWELRHTTLTVSPISPGGLSQVIVRESPPRFGSPDAPRVVTRYVYGLGLLYEVGADDSAHYYHGDQVGSTLAMTDDRGKVEARFEYSPYGVLTRSKIESLSSAALDTPFLFCGESGCMTDAASGLVHMRARWYNPWLCRFISEDPIQFKGGMNWYGYCGGDPVMMFDPTGLTVDIPDWSDATKTWLSTNSSHIATFAGQYGVAPRDLANALAEEHSRLWMKDGFQDSLGSYSSALVNQVNAAASYWANGTHRHADLGPANINFDSAKTVMRPGEFRYSTGGSDQGLVDYLITGQGAADYGARLMAQAQSVINPHIASVSNANEITALRTNAWREGLSELGGQNIYCIWRK